LGGAPGIAAVGDNDLATDARQDRRAFSLVLLSEQVIVENN